MSPSRKRGAVRELQAQFTVSERRACRVLDQPRSGNVAEILNQVMMMLGHEVFDHDTGKKVLVDHAFWTHDLDLSILESGP